MTTIIFDKIATQFSMNHHPERPARVSDSEVKVEKRGSVADRRKIHAASMLYHIQNGSVPKLAGTSN
jgi:hypothetical protein